MIMQGTRKKLPEPPHNFRIKKAQILSDISVHPDSYTDKSPKGSVDTPILDLIDELNSIEGIVTTSSCSGRVAVFVEGSKGRAPVTAGQSPHGEEGEEEKEDGLEDTGALSLKAITTGSPAGKGGGQWLYVSHEPVDIPSPIPPEYFTHLCGLSNPSTINPSPKKPPTTTTSTPNTARLIKLLFSPLILHIHTATLYHAKPLLTAAINAGYRESGLQSLRALDDPEAGATVGIRTAGLSFETVIGTARESPGLGPSPANARVYESTVSEEYLRSMFQVVNERFEWNVRRRERLRSELRRLFGLDVVAGVEWEDKEVRRRRKREEGLRRRREEQCQIVEQGTDDEDVDAGMSSIFK